VSNQTNKDDVNALWVCSLKKTLLNAAEDVET